METLDARDLGRLINVMARAGLRVSEALALKVDDVELGRRSGTLLVRTGKGLTERKLALSWEARDSGRAEVLLVREARPERTDGVGMPFHPGQERVGAGHPPIPGRPLVDEGDRPTGCGGCRGWREERRDCRPIIALNSIRTGVSLIKRSVAGLMDISLPVEERDQIEEIILLPQVSHASESGG